jgi:hypothetical protein
MLLGGKAVVTVRERSVLKITEVPGRSTIELETGKFALAVAREKMRPGEEIQIRTPNAIAGVRGTVVITEVNRQTAQLGAAAAAVLTRFYVLRGTITAQPINAGGLPVGTPLSIGAMQAYSGAGAATPTVAPVPPEQVGQITSGLQPSGPKGGSEAGQEQVKVQAVETAVALIGALTGSGATAMAAIVGPATGLPVDTGSVRPPTTAPLTPLDSIDVSTVELQIAGFIEFINQQLTLTSTIFVSNAPFSFVTGGPLLRVEHSTIEQVGAGLDVLRLRSGADVLLAGPAAIIHDSFLRTPGSLLDMVGGTLQSTTTEPLFDIDPSTIIAGTAVGGAGTFVITAGTVDINGPWLSAIDATLINGDPTANVASFLFIGDGAQVRSHSTLPFMTFIDSSVDTAGNVMSLRRSTASTPTRLTLDGPLLVASGSTFNHTSAGFSATFGTASPCCNGFFVGQGAELVSTTPQALIQLTSSQVIGNDAQSGGQFFTVADTFNGAPASEVVAPGSVSLQGPLLHSTGSTITELFNLLRVQRSTLTSTTTEPLITINGGTVTLGGTDQTTGNPTNGSLLNVFSSNGAAQVGGPSTVTLAGPLFLLTGGASLSATNNIVNVVNGGTYIGGGAGAMVQMNGASMTGGFNILSLFGLGGPSGNTLPSASLSGPVLNAINSTITLGSNVVFVGGTLTSTTTAPLVQLSGTNLTAGTTFAFGELLQIPGGVALNGADVPGLVTLNGPVFSAGSGSTLNIPGPLLGTFSGGQLVVNTSTDPLYAFNGGTHQFATAANVSSFLLNGLVTQTALEVVEEGDPDFILDLGTRQPVQAAGSLLEMTGASASPQGIVRIDTALYEASRPVVHLKAGSTLTVANDGIDLITKAKLTTSAINPLVRLDASTLTIGNGHLALVRGGSFLNVGGDFLLMNSSTLNLNNGSFFMAQGGSFVKITGALVNFGTGGNTVNVTNNLCGSPCTVIGGLNVFLTNGALAGNVSIHNPITNAGGGTINLSNGATTAHLVVDGATTQVRIGVPPP